MMEYGGELPGWGMNFDLWLPDRTRMRSFFGYLFSILGSDKSELCFWCQLNWMPIFLWGDSFLFSNLFCIEDRTGKYTGQYYALLCRSASRTGRSSKGFLAFVTPIFIYVLHLSRYVHSFVCVFFFIRGLCILISPTQAVAHAHGNLANCCTSNKFYANAKKWCEKSTHTAKTKRIIKRKIMLSESFDVNLISFRFVVCSHFFCRFFRPFCTLSLLHFEKIPC